MPKCWLRTIGPDAAIGVLNTINPIDTAPGAPGSDPEGC